MGNTDRAIAKWRLAKHTATLTDKTAGVILYAPNMIKRLMMAKRASKLLPSREATAALCNCQNLSHHMTICAAHNNKLACNRGKMNK
ncbi:MAG: hypothetical protein ACPHN1_04400, partial [Candidatus Puniceispirillaceae bacterium]